MRRSCCCWVRCCCWEAAVEEGLGAGRADPALACCSCCCRACSPGGGGGGAGFTMFGFCRGGEGKKKREEKRNSNSVLPLPLAGALARFARFVRSSSPWPLEKTKTKTRRLFAPRPLASSAQTRCRGARSASRRVPLTARAGPKTGHERGGKTREDGNALGEATESVVFHSFSTRFLPFPLSNLTSSAPGARSGGVTMPAVWFGSGLTGGKRR